MFGQLHAHPPHPAAASRRRGRPDRRRQRRTTASAERDPRPVHRRLLAELSPTVRTDNVEEVRRALERIFSEMLAEEDMPLSRAERDRALRADRGRASWATARSSRSCRTTASPKSWSTGRTRSTSSATASWRRPTSASATPRS